MDSFGGRSLALLTWWALRLTTSSYRHLTTQSRWQGSNAHTPQARSKQSGSTKCGYEDTEALGQGYSYPDDDGRRLQELLHLGKPMSPATIESPFAQM